MGRMSRDKGVKGEREVAAILEANGFHVRGLESGGDHLCVRREEAPLTCEPPTLLHVEAKRQEILRIPLWLDQLESDCPAHALGLLAFRQNRHEWYAALKLQDLLSSWGTPPGWNQ